MRTNEFSCSVSIDMVPRGSRCEWCGKPATQHITALGGLHHNQSALFCARCGLEFVRMVLSELRSQNESKNNES